MNVLRLARNVQFVYEAQLASVEARALGCAGWQPDAADPWKVRSSVEGHVGPLLGRAAYLSDVDGRPAVYDQLVRPAYQGGRFNGARSVNQHLTHWIYPYRGKFHPQLVRALLNILGAGPGARVLDPYVGSGTTVLEASLLGASAVGVDQSPLCVLLTRVKTASLGVLPELRSVVSDVLSRPDRDLSLSLERDRLPAPVRDFLRVWTLLAESDVSRRRRNRAASLRRNLRRMLDSVEAYARAVDCFGLVPGPARALVGDASALPASAVTDGSIDAVVTSPPYSAVLDYVVNDQPALAVLGVDQDALRERMTGLRGQGLAERRALYREDLRAMLRCVFRVLRPGGRAAFVVGNGTVSGSEDRTTAELPGWAEDAGLGLDLRLRKCVFGLYNVMKDEDVLIFRKPATSRAGGPGLARCARS